MTDLYTTTKNPVRLSKNQQVRAAVAAEVLRSIIESDVDLERMDDMLPGTFGWVLWGEAYEPMERDND